MKKAHHPKKPLSPDPIGLEADPDMGAHPVAPVLSEIVADDAAVNVMTDVMGGSGDARFRAKIILQRFALEGWEITKPEATANAALEGADVPPAEEN